jgi:hypothetical protein
MNDRDTLRKVIRTAFSSVPFPVHRGLRAAASMDGWNTDPIRLAGMTAEQDVHGEWWEIPACELLEWRLGLMYLDAEGVEFYLPAYLTMALEEWIRLKVKLVLEALDPGEESSSKEGLELARYFEQRFVRIVGSKRGACVGFLDYAVQHLDPADELSGHEVAVRIRAHDFWK